MFALIDFNYFNIKGRIDKEDNPFQESSEDEDNNDDNDWDKNEYFVIQMFGINEKGETCCIYIDDYKPFFYVKIGKKWTSAQMAQFVAEIKQKIGPYYNKSLLSTELVSKNQLYGFTGGETSNFIKFTFDNTSAMNKVRNLWYKYLSEEDLRYSLFSF